MRDKHKRWDLCLGGTNVAPPLGREWEPWPGDWLDKNFFNTHLLLADPRELRETFDNRYPTERWVIISNILHAIEEVATLALREDPEPFKKLVLLPEGYVSLETIITRRKAYLDALTEDEFWKFFGYEKLTSKQANAITALRSIGILRSEYFYSKNGQYHHVKDADPWTAKMLLEMALLVLAAIRGDLWERHWPTLANEKKRTEKIAVINRDKKHIAEQRKQRVFQVCKRLRKISAGKVLNILAKDKIFSDWEKTTPDKASRRRTVERYIQEYRATAASIR